MNIVVIGAVALGPKAACRVKRLLPEARVLLVDQSEMVSYGGCGIPFYVSGEISRLEDLRSTPYGALRDEEFFREAKGVELLTATRVTGIDRKARKVHLLDLKSGAENELGYDKLVLATGSRPSLPPIAGLDLAGVHTATSLEEAHAVRERVSRGDVNEAVVVGGGFIGVEMAVALADLWGIPVTLLEREKQVLPGFLSPGLARMLEKDLTDHGVQVVTGRSIAGLSGLEGRVSGVTLAPEPDRVGREILADLVVMATGVRPETELAKQAGLDLTEQGLVLVDEELRTSDPDIYAGGDCVAIRNQITGKPFWLPLGSQANRQGRVIGSNLAGKAQRFAGGVGAWCVKGFALSAAGTGLTLEAALAHGFDAIRVHVEQVDRAHFYPEHAMMALEAVVDRSTRRLLGVSGICANGDALVGRINAVTPLLAARVEVADLCTLELAYSPPFASAMDVLNLLGNVTENILDGRARMIDPAGFPEFWKERGKDGRIYIDTRVRGQAEKHPAAGQDYWLSIPQDELADRLGELPPCQEIILVCNTGLRAYEAQLVLLGAGMSHNRTVAGGLSALAAMGYSTDPDEGDQGPLSN